MLGMTASKITCFHFCNLFESACAQKECMVASSHMSLLSTTHVGALSGGRAVASVYTGADCYPAVSTVHVTTARPERLKSMHGISPLHSQCSFRKAWGEFSSLGNSRGTDQLFGNLLHIFTNWLSYSLQWVTIVPCLQLSVFRTCMTMQMECLSHKGHVNE